MTLAGIIDFAYAVGHTASPIPRLEFFDNINACLVEGGRAMEELRVEADQLYSHLKLLGQKSGRKAYGSSFSFEDDHPR